MNLFETFLADNDISVNFDEKNFLSSVKYLHLGVDWTKSYILDARGLVITPYGEIVGRPYEKFFNYHQMELFEGVPEEVKDLCRWKSGPFRVMDKADGSLVVAYTYLDKLFLSSSGAVEGTYSELFFKLLDTYPAQTKERLKKVGETLTLSLEYVSPMNQIVLEYYSTKFILHGARNTKTGKYLSYDEIVELSEYLGIELIGFYEGINGLNTLLSSLERLKEKEGFVVWFEDHDFRLKFKTEEYMELHRCNTPMYENFKTKRFANNLVDMLAEDTFDDFASNLPKHRNEKINAVFKSIVNVALDAYKELIDEYTFINEFSNDHLFFAMTDPKGYYEFITDVTNDELNIFDATTLNRITKSIIVGKSVPTIYEKLLDEKNSARRLFAIYMKERINEIPRPSLLELTYDEE